MSVQIIDNQDGAVLYCSTDMQAFGPVFDDREQAEAFCDWFTEGHAISAAIIDGHCRIPELNGRTENDPRGYDIESLGRLHSIWLNQREGVAS